ncbi:hypothetical protein SISSUDRAFT_1030907 [Sistotremastrum suecicum HHB10207 ss-3]|uniref:Uncharacterized protein n=1 Tax=Sistotremastrum suecicum HHB10207 ss-3 TaxID=1314776 RepID=A0A166GST9_9AGAM|nr:hypothetical protein SISSUDRAFT_1030907 [Sistotremastrum suecicum HHB10207 ss-3]
MLFHSLSGGTLSENPHVKHDISLLHESILLAEIERASPFEGDFSIAASAAAHMDQRVFVEYWASTQVVDFLPTRPAILRKDFILDESQNSETMLYGADTQTISQSGNCERDRPAIHGLRNTLVPVDPPVGNSENQGGFATQAHALEKAIRVDKPLIVRDVSSTDSSQSPAAFIWISSSLWIGAAGMGDLQDAYGSRTVIDLSFAKTAVDRGEPSRREGSTTLPITLAGGLSPGNVADVVTIVQPRAVE